MHIPSDSQQNAPTFFTGFLWTTKTTQVIYKTLSKLTPTNIAVAIALPVLKIWIVLPCCWYRYEPPQDQPIENHWVSRGDPQAKLEKECVQLHCQEYDAKSEYLNKTPRSLQRMPLVFVPVSWCELPQCPFHFANNVRLAANANPLICFSIKISNCIHSCPDTYHD
jgi:hypothetical protein